MGPDFSLCEYSTKPLVNWEPIPFPSWVHQDLRDIKLRGEFAPLNF